MHKRLRSNGNSAVQEVKMSHDDGRSGSDLADVDRASRAGEDDGEAGTYDSEDKLAGDTDDQKDAYNASYDHASSESD